MDLIDRQTAIDTFHAYAPGIPWDKLDMIFAEIPSVQASGDLIDRQEVDKIINDLLENDNLQASPSVWHGLHRIKQLPSAQPERKKGKWNDYPIADGCIQCSECGILRMVESSNYCPNCGADMRGEQPC